MADTLPGLVRIELVWSDDSGSEQEPNLHPGESGENTEDLAAAESLIINYEYNTDNDQQDDPVGSVENPERKLESSVSTRKKKVGDGLVEEGGSQTKSRAALARHQRKTHRTQQDRRKYHLCSLCDYRSQHRSSVKKHEEAIHLGISYSCTHCTFVCTFKQSLEKHIKAKHGDGEKQFSCDLCDFRTSTAHYLKSHVNMVHLKLRLACDECVYMAADRSALSQHKKTRHLGIKHNCTRCDYKANRKVHLRKHVLSVHFSCELCPATHNSIISLKQHLVDDHLPQSEAELIRNEDSDLCQLDNDRYIPTEEDDEAKIYIPSELLNFYRTEIFSLKKLLCDVCHQNFSRLSVLKQHLQTKHSVEMSGGFPCGDCNYRGAVASALKLHVESVHKGIRYPCNQCDYKATKPSHLNHHNKSVHLKLKRFECEQCDYRGCYPSDVKRHRNQMHSGQRASQAGQQTVVARLVCTLCPFRARKEVNLAKHIRKKHKSDSTISCEEPRS